jgi:chromate transporter
MALGFVIVAGYRIGRKVVTNSLAFGLLIFGATITYLIRAPWIFPLVLFIGGLISIITSKEKNLWNHVKINPPWKFLIAFFVIALVSLFLTLFWDNKIVHLFESFYRYGYLVIGGGQVVVPIMYSELVEVRQYMTNQDFLTGFGLVQGLPGPMFSFSAYAGGMATRSGSASYQILGAILSAIGIFLPGLLLIFFVYPVWEKLKTIKGIKISLKGITAVACGLIVAAAIVMFQKNGLEFSYIFVSFLTAALLMTKKIPAPFIVVGSLVLGFVG